MSKKFSFKKTLAVLVAALTAFLLVAPALASSLPPQTGNLHIHKYIGGPTGDLNDGTELDPSGWTEAIPANGVQFDVYSVDTSAGIPASGKTYVLSGSNLLVYDTDNTLLGTYAVTLAESITTTGNATASALNLDQGIYLVVENSAASTNITNANTGEPLFISAACAPFLVAVPMTNPDGDGWLEDVHVYPKNEGLTVDKTVSTDEAVSVGDTISYAITVSVPSDIATSKKFDITDVLDPALDIVLSSVAVATLPTDIGLIEGVSNDYTVSYDDASRKLTVSFTDQGREALEGSTHVVLTFDVTINSTILSYEDNIVSNTGKVEFTNTNDVDYDAESDDGDADIYTAAIKITKLDENGESLNGSSFKIATSAANAAAGHFLRIDSDGVLYDFDPANPTASAWAMLGSSADYQIDPANTASFKGLTDKVNGVYQTYYIVETQAPAGYNLLTEAISVTFDGSEIDYTYSLTVNNSKGFTLPITGGMGTILFTVIGIALLGTAIIVAISRKRKTTEKHF